ncbi:hypothetical protein C2E23DRAFT_840672 [Lenzites betulinus]|nr:hypothetical protein C2E23DRAFT_840672 [Lenzites betulinus]
MKEIEALQIARDDASRALEIAQGTVQAQQAELATARAQAAAAEEAVAHAHAEANAAQQLRAQLQAQLEAAGAPHEAGTVNLPEIPRPAGTGWSIREAMEIDHSDYAEIQRSIRSLVIRSQLDWTDDFRRQDPDKLATFFRAARKAHPVLRRYMNNWATAAIARQYMQNKRKHAYKQGYIKKKPAPGDQHGIGPRRDGDGEGGGALAA